MLSNNLPHTLLAVTFDPQPLSRILHESGLTPDPHLCLVVGLGNLLWLIPRATYVSRRVQLLVDGPPRGSESSILASSSPFGSRGILNLLLTPPQDAYVYLPSRLPSCHIYGVLLYGSGAGVGDYSQYWTFSW
jgi:hypothetical protein